MPNDAFRSLSKVFVESVSDYAIFALDHSGRVASWNSTAQKIIGYTSEEIVGKHFSILYRPDERRGSVPIQALELAVQKGRHEVEGWRTRKDGTPFFVTGVLTAIHDENAKLIGFASIFRDATERLDTQEKLVEARERPHHASTCVVSMPVKNARYGGESSAPTSRQPPVAPWTANETLTGAPPATVAPSLQSGATASRLSLSAGGAGAVAGIVASLRSRTPPIAGTSNERVPSAPLVG